MGKKKHENKYEPKLKQKQTSQTYSSERNKYDMKNDRKRMHIKQFACQKNETKQKTNTKMK